MNKVWYLILKTKQNNSYCFRKETLTSEAIEYFLVGGRVWNGYKGIIMLTATCKNTGCYLFC